jgi:hypothetical protein
MQPIMNGLNIQQDRDCFLALPCEIPRSPRERWGPYVLDQSRTLDNQKEERPVLKEKLLKLWKKKYLDTKIGQIIVGDHVFCCAERTG